MVNSKFSRILSIANHLVILYALIILANGCKKETDQTTPSRETGTVTDIDGNVYQTVKIGSQWWMTEDLKVTKYRNGSSITKIQTDNVAWSSDSAGAYSDNIDNAQKVIGKLYNGYAVTNGNNIAPAGWHIPSDEEWKTLEKSLGMSQADADKSDWRGTNEGEKLKIESPKGWTRFGEVWDTNESGFTALANGCRLYNGNAGDPGLFATGFWWSSSKYGTGEVWYRYLDYKNANIYRSHVFMTYGFSIRCVKD
jgi:uncharacterized protein (TIGR02145 family)